MLIKKKWKQSFPRRIYKNLRMGMVSTLRTL